jgi:hypothetical protein
MNHWQNAYTIIACLNGILTLFYLIFGLGFINKCLRMMMSLIHNLICCLFCCRFSMCFKRSPSSLVNNDIEERRDSNLLLDPPQNVNNNRYAPLRKSHRESRQMNSLKSSGSLFTFIVNLLLFSFYGALFGNFFVFMNPFLLKMMIQSSEAKVSIGTIINQIKSINQRFFITLIISHLVLLLFIFIKDLCSSFKK